VNYAILLVVLSAVCYRVSRFIVLDTLIDAPRNAMLSWLEMRPNAVTYKLIELIGCPWCITIWVSAGTVAVQHFVVDPVPVPIWTWLAVATGSLVFWGIIDRE
jgi:hypothetical protein